jgi:SAM-dependent methyltransferase
MTTPPADALASCMPTPEEIERTLAPLMVERMACSDPQFRDRHARQTRKWRLKLLGRRLLGWLPEGKRTQAYVERSYDRTFAARPWPETNGAVLDAKPTWAEWGEAGLVVRRYGLGRVHLLAMARIIRALGARTVLEVGSGTGINLFVLAALLPEVAFAGIELTATGVAQAQSVVQAATLPARLADYCPAPVADAQAHRRIDVRRGNALDLPFQAGAFDLVFTRQALEQMDMIRAPALAQIARVARSHVLLVEPFADANRDRLRRAYVAAKDYFSLPVTGLEAFGIAPVFTSRAFPQNIRLGIELVVGRRS